MLDGLGLRISLVQSAHCAGKSSRLSLERLPDVQTVERINLSIYARNLIEGLLALPCSFDVLIYRLGDHLWYRFHSYSHY